MVDYDSTMIVSVSSIDSAKSGRERYIYHAKSIDINPDTSIMHITDSIDWARLINVPDLSAGNQYAMDYRDFYDWQTWQLYSAIPLRPKPETPDLSQVKTTYKFAPLQVDDATGKLIFWWNSSWHTLTSN
jgi:hypothetical protein